MYEILLSHLSLHILPSYSLSSLFQLVYQRVPKKKNRNTNTNHHNLPITTKNKDQLTANTTHHPEKHPMTKHLLQTNQEEERREKIHLILLHVCFVVHQIKNGMKMLWICIIGRYPHSYPHILTLKLSWPPLLNLC